MHLDKPNSLRHDNGRFGNEKFGNETIPRLTRLSSSHSPDHRPVEYAAQVDGIEQQRADVDILPAGGSDDLPGNHQFGGVGRPPDHGRLAGLDQQGEDLGEFART